MGSFDTIRYHAGGAYSVLRDGVWVGVNNVVGLPIAIAGNYVGKDPDAETLAKVNRLIAFIDPLLPPQPRRIVGHQNVSATSCPGDNWEEWRGTLRVT